MFAERVKDWSRAWRQQGWEEGRQEGRQEGESALLARLVELRFGALAEADRARLHEADAETLLRWGERVLTAQTLAEVVGE